jgi:Zn-finger nucleic acid-binding protein
MKTYYFLCCGIEISMPDSEIDTCPSCKKVCFVFSEDEDIIPKKAKEIDLGKYDLKYLFTGLA